MDKPKILLSGLGGSLFPYLHDQLCVKFTPYYVDVDESLFALYPGLNFFPAPLVTSPEYVRFIRELIKREKVDFYTPLIDEEIPVAHKIVEGISCSLISPKLEFSVLCLNKLALMKRLEEEGISSILSWRGDEFPANVSYPIFVKPVVGRGSRGARKIESWEQFQAYLQLEGYTSEELIIQEHIVGQEYTVGVLTGEKNELLCVSSRKVLMKKGVTIKAVTENNSIINDLVDKIQEVFKPSGPYNVQLYLDAENKPKVFEINPRFSTTLVMSYAAGIDELELYVSSINKGTNSTVFPKVGVELRRNWRNNFIYPASNQ